MSFPIANMLRTGCRIETPNGWGSEVALSTREENRALLDSCVFFEVSVASQLYWQGRQDYYSLEADFGPLRAPYPRVWMEWAIPTPVMIDGRWHDRIRPQHWAAYVECEEVSYDNFTAENAEQWVGLITRGRPEVIKEQPGPDDYEELAMAVRLKYAGHRSIHLSVTEMLTGPDGRVYPQMTAHIQPGGHEITNSGHGVDGVIMIPLIKVINLDFDTGRYIPESAAEMPPAESVRRDPAGLEMVRALMDTNVVWMALQLVNCRNVTTKQQGSVFTRSSTDKRRGEPVVKYHTIVLPGQQGHSTGRRHGSRQDPLALHKVRGHFKTFGPEAPLMGKHVGTYWWGWSIRGNKEHGEVISDYLLKNG